LSAFFPFPRPLLSPSRSINLSLLCPSSVLFSRLPFLMVDAFSGYASRFYLTLYSNATQVVSLPLSFFFCSTPFKPAVKGLPFSSPPGRTVTSTSRRLPFKESLLFCLRFSIAIALPSPLHPLFFLHSLPFYSFFSPFAGYNSSQGPIMFTLVRV